MNVTLDVLTVALIVGVLGPSLTFVSVFVANFLSARLERQRWQREQEFEQDKWLRTREAERQNRIRTELYDTYRNCLQSLSDIVIFEVKADRQGVEEAFSLINRRKKEAEKWLILLLLYLFRGEMTEYHETFRTKLFAFLSLEVPNVMKPIEEEAQKGSKIIEEAQLLRFAVLGLARRDPRLEIADNNSLAKT